MSAKSSKTIDLEKQIDAAVEAGMIPGEAPKSAKRGRGRPAGKSAERPQAPAMLTPEEKRIENEKKVAAIIATTQKRQLICKLRAFCAYFPRVAGQVSTLELEELEVKQLQALYDAFRDSVLGEQEINFIPASIKKGLCKIEDTVVGIGLANPDGPYSEELLKFQGLSENILEDKSIDDNVKLISIELAGKVPRNPYLNILTGVFWCALDTYGQANKRRVAREEPMDPKYSKLVQSKN